MSVHQEYDGFFSLWLNHSFHDQDGKYFIVKIIAALEEWIRMHKYSSCCLLQSVLIVQQKPLYDEI